MDKIEKKLRQDLKIAKRDMIEKFNWYIKSQNKTKQAERLLVEYNER